MYNFSHEIPEDPRGNSLPLMRCPTNKPISGIVTSDDLIGTNTHYYRGRTIPCDTESCPACSEGFPWRWHSYVSLYSVSSHRTVLFEMTARAAEPLKVYRDAYGTLRGCRLTAKRSNSSPNSQVNIQTQRADLQEIALPAEPNLLEALSIIWNIELPSISVAGIEKQMPRASVRRNQALRKSTMQKSTTASQSQSPNGDGSSDVDK